MPNYSYISSVLANFEGSGLCRGYIPTQNGKIIGNSGVTIGTGVDLGQQTRDGLIAMGVPATIVGCLVPYLGLRGEAALAKLNKVPLTLSADAIQKLDQAIIKSYIDNTVRYFNKSKLCVRPFTSCPKEVQAVTASLAYQLGLRGFPRTLNYLRQGDYDQAILELEDPACWNGKYMTRRRGEAKILREVIKA